MAKIILFYKICQNYNLILYYNSFYKLDVCKLVHSAPDKISFSFSDIRIAFFVIYIIFI